MAGAFHMQAIPLPRRLFGALGGAGSDIAAEAGSIVLMGDPLEPLPDTIRLARRTGRDDVTAMPLGIDTPSLFGLAFGVLVPAFLLTRDA